jgi:hypothetical protein
MDAPVVFTGYGGTMLRRLNPLAAFAFIFCLSGHAQDSPSLGELARQAQKNKSTAPAKKVFTNEDLPSGSAPASPALVPGLTQSGQPTASANPAAAPSSSPSSSEQLAQMELKLNQLGALDRATLVKNALQGANPDFPGHVEWEARLLTARQVFVLQGHAQLEKMKQMQSTAQSLNGSHDPNDPRVKDLSDRAKQVMQDAVRTGAAFEAVVLEGRDLAAHSSSR